MKGLGYNETMSVCAYAHDSNDQCRSNESMTTRMPGLSLNTNGAA